MRRGPNAEVVSNGIMVDHHSLLVILLTNSETVLLAWLEVSDAMDLVVDMISIEQMD